MLWCSVQKIREHKSRMVMEALARGWPGARVCDGDPPDDGQPLVIYGQTWGAERLIPKALKVNRPFFQIDNGFYKPGRGKPGGYYRSCYGSLSPVFLRDADTARARSINAPPMKPWRKNGRHILLAMPGGDFGTALGLSMPDWEATIKERIKQFSGRPVVVRDRSSTVPLSSDLECCWALVTHSSNVAVEAVRAGVPVFVAPTSAAVPVGNLDLENLEAPAMPDYRDEWWASLMCQQFNVAEMRNGTAFRYMSTVVRQVDGSSAAVAA